MCDDEWVKVAMGQDTLVADLLLRLQRPWPTSCFHLRWTVRQRRSSHGAPLNSRASPTTPLSWSASGDAYDHSTPPPKPSQTTRSKVANPSETATTRKSRRKKTLAELKEEENLLLKEKRSLKKELASLHVTVEKHRATNESLKRMKLDFESRENSVVSGKGFNGPKTVTHDDSAFYAANACLKAQEIGNQESTFVLPDLNLPVDEDFCVKVIH
ncbi:hypothetical protein VNO78_14558 [Psophocarpus tetragonolobus]|uniref:Uncharacterized protein n=1 Tax=Psophocarpus tetragonolobus TaxID=3891 RepID=A0AAN9T011_PSOTE